MRFSQRMGFMPVRQAIQKDDMDDALRNRLWNVMYSIYLDHDPDYILSVVQRLGIFVKILWRNYFKVPADRGPYSWGQAYSAIRDHYFGAPWYVAYDLIEFIVNNSSTILPEYQKQEAVEQINDALGQELSGYRFVGETIAPIISEIEVASIEQALQLTDIFAPVQTHLNQALKLLADREHPDYKNSIKESISAVESMASLIAGRDKAELSSALDRIKGKLGMHAAFERALKQLYGYTSDEVGIRHAALEEKNLDQEDAVFMLVSCSAFVNYLKLKAEKVGVPFA